MINTQTFCLPLDASLHMPTHSGTYLSAMDKDFVHRSVQALICPLMVVEHQRSFTGYTWSPWTFMPKDSIPVISRQENRWQIAWRDNQSVRKMADHPSLEEVIAEFRKLRSFTQPSSHTTLQRIKRIIFLDLWLVRGQIAHTYHDVIRLLKELDSKGIACGTLLYLPGWFAPYDSRYPLYTPAEELGGQRVFREMIDLSIKVGSIIMPHLNFWGYDPGLNLLDRDQVQGHTMDGKLGWPDHCDLSPCHEIAYMRINHPEWQKLFFRHFDTLVQDYRLEAVFLDQIGNAFEDTACDFVSATINMLQRMHKTFPSLLLGGEGFNEMIVDHVSLVQLPWLSADLSDLATSPITYLLYKGYIRFFPHLFLPSATPCRYTFTNLPWLAEQGTDKAFLLYQELNRKMGGIPSVRLDYQRFGIDSKSLLVLESAR